jgi:serine/threonine protein kinase
MASPVAQGDWRMPEQPQVSEGCRDLLHRVLVKDPELRLSLAEVMAHPWFQEASALAAVGPTVFVMPCMKR